MPSTRLDRLIFELAKRQVTVLVGTGVSVYSTGNAPSASWKNLLTEGINYCKEWANPMPSDETVSQQREKLVTSGVDDLLSVATAVEAALGGPSGGLMREFLKETVGGLKATSHEMLEGIKAFHEAGAVIATTNYDGLLEDALALPAVPWTRAAEVEHVLRGRSDGVLHLHGWWREPESVVLGIRSYDAVRGNEHAQMIQKLIALGRIIVFLGYGSGLGDPNFGALLGWMADLPQSGLMHFRLCRDGEEEQLRTEHAKDARVSVLPYGRQYADLGPFLKEVAGAANALTASSPTLSTGAHTGEISFMADCVLDPKSLRGIMAVGSRAPTIQFHHSVISELTRVEDWWTNFDSRSKIFPWFANQPELRAAELTRLRARLRENRDRIQSVLSAVPEALARAVSISAGAPPELREESLGQLARFTAIQIIRLLQFTEAYLPDKGPSVHTCFATLPLVPRWLVDLIPTRSAIGELVFREDQFLLARIGVSENSYESLVIPRYRGQALHKSGAVGDDDLYYKWVVPQWIHYRFERPLPDKAQWRVWVLTDDLGRECYMSSDKRPWEE
jgi:hypothetical protein